MANNRSLPLLPTDIFQYAVRGADVTEKEVTQIMGAMACTSRLWNSQLQDTLNSRMLKSLLSAVIDDDREMVKRILDKSSDLLLITPPENLVIESQHTWQKFYAESALKMAAKLKQLNMINVLLPYYDKLEQTEDLINAKKEALACWKAYEIQKNANYEDEIVIPKKYADDAQSLVDVFKDETFPNGVPGENDAPINVALSEKTELALQALLNKLVPENAVKLDKHIDVELLLLAIFKAFVKGLDSLDYDWNKLNTLCVRLIGLTQSALIPETAAIWCESLYGVLEAIHKGEVKEISPAADAHKLKGGEDFYRNARASRLGLGFEFLCGWRGKHVSTMEGLFFSAGGRWGESLSEYIGAGVRVLEKLCQAKTTGFWKCYAAIAAPTRPSPSR